MITGKNPTWVSMAQETAHAGITRDRLILQMTEDDFTEILNTNLTSVLRTVKRATKGRVRMPTGRVILISSVSGFYGAPARSTTRPPRRA